MAMRSFIDEEAGIDSEEDVDGDEEEAEALEAIEGEEADISGFINDSSQLGYSPDALDEAEPTSRGDAVHQAVDNERLRAHQFATPLLNRRMQDAKSQDSWNKNAPDSATGLGNMHFIQSVIQRHEEGRRAEDIERLYNDMEEEASPINEATLRPEPEPPTKTVLYYEASDSEED